MSFDGTINLFHVSVVYFIKQKLFLITSAKLINDATFQLQLSMELIHENLHHMTFSEIF